MVRVSRRVERLDGHIGMLVCGQLSLVLVVEGWACRLWWLDFDDFDDFVVVSGWIVLLEDRRNADTGGLSLMDWLVVFKPSILAIPIRVFCVRCGDRNIVVDFLLDKRSDSVMSDMRFELELLSPIADSISASGDGIKPRENISSVS